MKILDQAETSAALLMLVAAYSPLAFEASEQQSVRNKPPQQYAEPNNTASWRAQNACRRQKCAPRSYYRPPTY